jgi:hypothetical protein
MGFSSTDSMRALEKSQAGTDLQAAITWLMDNSSESSSLTVSTTSSDSLLAQKSQPEIKEVVVRQSPSLPLNPKSTWTTVVRKPPASSNSHEVIGAGFAIKTRKTRHSSTCSSRGSSAASHNQMSSGGRDAYADTADRGDASAMGVIELESGRFTWILETSAQEHKPYKLTGARAEALKRYLNSVLHNTWVEINAFGGAAGS